MPAEKSLEKVRIPYSKVSTILP